MTTQVNSDEQLVRSARVFGVMAVAWILLDSMFTYFANHWFGFLPPVNSLLLVMLFSIVVTHSMQVILPPTSFLTVLVTGFVAFLSGKVLTNQIDIFRIGEVVLSFAVFFMAFFAFRWSNDVESYAKVFLYVSLGYVVVCVLALLKIFPTVFPIVNAVWSNDGIPVLRPEITTDQNFQIFYLFPVVLLLALPFRAVRFGLVIVSIVGALFILAKIQTRSGFMVFCGAALLALLAPIWTKSLGRRKVIIMPILLVVTVLVNHDLIIHVGDNLITRFTERTGIGLGKEMGQDRLNSTLFTLQHLFDPEWWVPRGSQEFINRYGFLPHSTLTAVYLEGGLVGLVMWLAIFIFPLLALGFMLLKRKLDPLATIVLIGGLASLAIQMSLHVPFFKHTWLWAGAVLGTLIRVRSPPLDQFERTNEIQVITARQAMSWVRYASITTERQRRKSAEYESEG